MANPVTDYKLNYSQADVERLARYIYLHNSGITYQDAYTKAVRVLGRASGQYRSKLR